jgi:hypothetical protein
LQPFHCLLIERRRSLQTDAATHFKPMLTTRDERPAVVGDAEIDVTHFIPSVQLKGTRADKLEKLDLVIAHLEELRRSLEERQPLPRGWKMGPPHAPTRSDMWWAADWSCGCRLPVGARHSSLRKRGHLNYGFFIES